MAGVERQPASTQLSQDACAHQTVDGGPWMSRDVSESSTKACLDDLKGESGRFKWEDTKASPHWESHSGFHAIDFGAPWSYSGSGCLPGCFVGFFSDEESSVGGIWFGLILPSIWTFQRRQPSDSGKNSWCCRSTIFPHPGDDSSLPRGGGSLVRNGLVQAQVLKNNLLTGKHLISLLEVDE